MCWAHGCADEKRPMVIGEERYEKYLTPEQRAYREQKKAHPVVSTQPCRRWAFANWVLERPTLEETYRESERIIRGERPNTDATQGYRGCMPGKYAKPAGYRYRVEMSENRLRV